MFKKTGKIFNKKVQLLKEKQKRVEKSEEVIKEFLINRKIEENKYKVFFEGRHKKVIIKAASKAYAAELIWLREEIKQALKEGGIQIKNLVVI